MRYYVLILVLALAFIVGVQTHIVQASGDFTPLEQVIRKSRPKERSEIVRRIAYVINQEADRYGLDPSFLAAMIWVESRFKYTATGGVGEIGLMQIRFEAWHKSTIFKRCGVDSKTKLRWIGKNVQCGAGIIKYCLDRSNGDVVRALYRYNSGSPNLPRGIPRHEISYANKVLIKMYDISEQTRRR
jgi:soluble lytic murein transglycosylase-like protein